MNADPTKILVVDDSALYRQSIQNVLRDVADVQVVGWAKDGLDALEKIEQLEPDLLTLDVQMPDMDGIRVLQQIKRRGLRAKAIMVSSLTAKGAQVTTQALMEGAFDFILKPSSSDSAANRRQLHDALEEKILAFRESCRADGRARTHETEPANGDASETVPTAVAECQAVIVACSTGGPEALKTVLPKLPVNLPVPVLVVQHMPAQYTQSLALRLDELCEAPVVEAADNLPATPGRVIVAAGGRQMKMQRQQDRLLVRVTDDPPENGVRPSADYLIRSAVETLGGDLLAVVLTGMGKDGLDGCRKLKAAGGFVFAQSHSDCVVYGMPKTIIENDLADRILPLGKVAPAIVRHVKRSRR